MLATLRGLRGDKHLGDFYVDLMRSLVFVFVPVCPGRRGAAGRHGRADDLPGGGRRRRRSTARRPR